jgi:endonuclease YncB( thermonuclease family)
MRRSEFATPGLLLATLAVSLFGGRSTSAQEPKERAVLKGHGEAAFHLDFSPDGTLLASCGEPRVKVWDLRTGREIATFEGPEDARWGRSVAFSPDGKSLAFSWDDGTIQFWDTIARGRVATLGRKADGIPALAYSSDGRILAFTSTPTPSLDPSSRGTSIVLWDLVARKEVAALTGHAMTIFSIAVSPDDKTIVSAGADRTVRLWELGARRQRAVLQGHKGAVWAVAIARDGKTVASGCADGTIQFWDASTVELHATVKGHDSRITALAFAPDGKTMASTGGDNRLRLWDTTTRKQRVAIEVPGERVHGVAFAPDGRTMATGNVDGIIRLWDMADHPAASRRQAGDGALRKDIVRGSIAHSPEDYLRITGTPRVIDGNTIAFDDGVEIDISGGMDAPALEQMGSIGDRLYPCGQEAAAFLRKRIGGGPVTCYINTKHGIGGGRGGRMQGMLYAGESRLDEAMIVDGWAVADHSSTVALELIAREHKRGLWRGKFVAPREWRKGARLPGEPPAPRLEPGAGPGTKGKSDMPTLVKEGPTVVKIVGKVEVLDAHTLRYADGTLVELNGGMDAPDLEQLAAVGDGLYPWGEQAADFLRKWIGSQVVTCHVEGRRDEKFRGACFVDETLLEAEMVRHGWAVSHHTAMDGFEMFASEGRRGVWRGRFMRPEDWRKGDRLPGEPGETRIQRGALQALRKFDPIVRYDESKPGRPMIAIQFRPNTIEKVGDNDLARLEVFTNLRSLDVPSAPKVTDAGLKHLAGLRPLVELNLNWTGVTGEGVVKLVKGRIMMERLEIAGVPFRDSDLAAMRGVPDLQTLSLRATLITDEGLARLKGFGKLRSLSLMNTGVSDAGLKHLESLTALEDLDLDRTAITDAGLAHLAGLRHLRRLQMAHTAVTDAALDRIQGLSSLRELNLRGTRVTGEAVARLKQRIPHLRVGIGAAPR